MALLVDLQPNLEIRTRSQIPHNVKRQRDFAAAGQQRVLTANRATFALKDRVTFSQYLITDHGRDLLHKVES